MKKLVPGMFVRSIHSWYGYQDGKDRQRWYDYASYNVSTSSPGALALVVALEVDTATVLLEGRLLVVDHSSLDTPWT